MPASRSPLSLLIIIIMKTIYIAPKHRLNGTLSASHINSLHTHTLARTYSHTHTHTHTHTHSHARTHARTYARTHIHLPPSLISLYGIKEWLKPSLLFPLKGIYQETDYSATFRWLKFCGYHLEGDVHLHIICIVCHHSFLVEQLRGVVKSIYLWLVLVARSIGKRRRFVIVSLDFYCRGVFYFFVFER